MDKEKTMSEIKKIMERESAKKLIDEFKLKICGVDLEKICSDDELIENAQEKLANKKTEAEEKAERIFNKYKRTLENAVMCGLVFWSVEEDCLCQRLIKPVTSGEQECNVLKYKNQLCLNDTKDQSDNVTQILIDNLCKITGRTKQLIGKLGNDDVDIATGCISFFGF